MEASLGGVFERTAVGWAKRTLLAPAHPSMKACSLSRGIFHAPGDHRDRCTPVRRSVLCQPVRVMSGRRCDGPFFDPSAARRPAPMGEFRVRRGLPHLQPSHSRGPRVGRARPTTRAHHRRRYARGLRRRGHFMVQPPHPAVGHRRCPHAPRLARVLQLPPQLDPPRLVADQPMS